MRRSRTSGDPTQHSNYPWGWAQAGNTPFKWYKQNTHEGGVHVPLIVHWPTGIAARGELRDQFHYVTDIAPTVSRSPASTLPESYRGLRQMPIAGSSIAYAFADADAAERKDVAVLRDGRAPRDVPRGLEGGHAPRPRRGLRRRPLGALPPRRGSLGVPRPGRSRPREGGRARRAVVARRRGASAYCRSTSGPRALRHAVPRQLDPPDQPPLHLPTDPLSRCRPAAAGIGGRSWDLRRSSSAGRGERGRHRGDREPRTPASASSSRTIGWCSTTTSSGEHHVLESERSRYPTARAWSACGSVAVAVTPT